MAVVDSKEYWQERAAKDNEGNSRPLFDVLADDDREGKDIKPIPLTHGCVATVDSSEFERLINMGAWYASYSEDRRVYAARNPPVGPKIYMHRIVVNAPNGVLVDHVDGDTLNNVASNLRLATPRQNSANSFLSRRNISGYKGVSYYKRDGTWEARIRDFDSYLFLGRFEGAEDAAIAYDNAARRLHGPFARINFPREGEAGVRSR